MCVENTKKKNASCQNYFFTSITKENQTKLAPSRSDLIFAGPFLIFIIKCFREYNSYDTTVSISLKVTEWALKKTELQLKDSYFICKYSSREKKIRKTSYKIPLICVKRSLDL